MEDQIKKNYQSLTDRLNKLDEFHGQVGQNVGNSMIDMSNRPAQYNPIEDYTSMTKLYSSNYNQDLRNQQNDATNQWLNYQKEQNSKSLNDRKMALEEATAGVKFDPKTGTYVPVAPETSVDIQSAVDAVKNKYKSITDYPKSIQPAIEKALSENVKSDAMSLKNDALETVNQILSKTTTNISGAWRLGMLIPGSPAQTQKALVEQLKARLSLDKRSLLKGSGTITDKEMKMLEDAVTGLNYNMGEKDFRDKLEKIKSTLETATGAKKDENSDPLGLGI